MIQFFVSLVPPTANHQSKKIVRVGGFSRLADSEQLRDARSIWWAALHPYRPTVPFKGPLSLSVTFVWPYLKGHSAKARLVKLIPKTTSPDCSNTIKTVEDVMASLLYFENDAQICELQVRKFYGESPGVHVRLGSVNGGA